mmetsp:Transcript_70352/g.187462  ORF Transcript_70352/g.187462 Transcript_70352/m.187462 type:complete len:255 (-) Transcript_70352:94-858(-)
MSNRPLLLLRTTRPRKLLIPPGIQRSREFEMRTIPFHLRNRTIRFRRKTHCQSRTTSLEILEAPAPTSRPPRGSAQSHRRCPPPPWCTSPSRHTAGIGSHCRRGSSTAPSRPSPLPRPSTACRGRCRCRARSPSTTSRCPAGSTPSAPTSPSPRRRRARPPRRFPSTRRRPTRLPRPRPPPPSRRPPTMPPPSPPTLRPRRRPRSRPSRPPTTPRTRISPRRRRSSRRRGTWRTRTTTCWTPCATCPSSSTRTR